jgi:hypothetical protein
MSMEKAIRYGKVHRQKYYDSRRFDWSCRHGGSCPWCIGNRVHNAARKLQAVEMDMQEWQEQYVRFWEDPIGAIELESVALSDKKLLKLSEDPKFKPDYEQWS